ncbi:M23 family metallopeptidase [Aurantiacibacter luteus]|uniref:M23ase beta-sheet core domain-containing protein n=1 Tax=Aurantiacibacter luteus TaxID=1581420 RepID=A0A0G9MYP4_9SPHN|nr:peptidoglycan DD-metalloendopeptidase family protein [Aurantiacibacter luteus]KLE35659.1 hypothetical protein AAW00_04475 [Aurantiacibacter luteus]
MASPFVEKVQVALVTATLVSAGWIVAGAFLLDRDETAAIREDMGYQSEADPVPAQEEQRSRQAERAPDTTPRVTTQPASQSAQLMIPVLGKSAADLTDTFTDDRGGGTRLHEAIDIMAEAGTSVVAAAPGKLERIFLSDAGGNTLYIRSDDGETIYYYAHLRDYAPGLTEGMAIRRGQRLGTVGSSGNADPTAPHLHFAMMRTLPEADWWEPSTAVNPFPLLTGRQ